MNYNSTRFGFILFSSVIIISVANLFNPLHTIFANQRINSNNIFPPRMKSKVTTEEGELITTGCVNYRLGTWKLKTSAKNDPAATSSASAMKNTACELEIINELDEELLLCWVDSDGCLHHYRQINDNSIKDNSVRNSHVEYTYTRDHFVCIRSTYADVSKLPSQLKDIQPGNFVFSYTPLVAKLRHTLKITKPVKLFLHALRGSSRPTVSVERIYGPIASEDQIIDTSTKQYNVREICGFRVFYEGDLFHAVDGFETVFNEDMTQLVRLIPKNACERLQSTTSIYINQSLSYGTVNKPVKGSGCCFHPLGDAEWLRRNGLNVCKEGCVEIFDAAGYLKSRNHWGAGGVLVHEFSHVYHNKFCDGSYDCEDIRQVGDSLAAAAAAAVLIDTDVYGDDVFIEGMFISIGLSSIMLMIDDIALSFDHVDDITLSFLLSRSLFFSIYSSIVV